jgi:hypothetical protein
VTRQGQAVEGATVSFMPVNVETGRSAIGVTDAQGRFVVETPIGGQNRAKGAEVGDYVVTVTKLNMVPRSRVISPEEWAKLPEEEREKMISGNTVGQKNKPGEMPGKGAPSSRADPASELPAKYGDVKKSDLLASVKAGAQNEFNFDLVD